MDYETYRNKYFVQTKPTQRYNYTGLLGITLFFQDFEEAVEFYQRVFGPPAYVEGEGTRGWQLGHTWFTLLRGTRGNPSNIEVQIMMDTPDAADRLRKAFLDAGASGPTPSDQLMYEPIRSCPVTDPFGTELMIFSRLPDAHQDTGKQ